MKSSRSLRRGLKIGSPKGFLPRMTPQREGSERFAANGAAEGLGQPWGTLGELGGDPRAARLFGGGMRVLVACEFSGVVRRAFRARGHDAWSCDLLPAEDGSPFHLQGDVRDVLQDDWDLMIAHPPCTYLAGSGLHWNKRRPERAVLTEEALVFVQRLLDAPIPKIALENPIGCISTRIRKPDQIIQPWQFGHDASKATCLWLKGLEPLRPTRVLEGGKAARRGNQTPSGQNRLGPSPTRWKERSRTYCGIAEAMAEQWG